MQITRRFSVGKPKLIVGLIALILGVLFSGGLYVAHAATAHDGRIISIYDRGQEKVIVTKATTVEGALEQANIQLDSHDNVEPARTQKLVASTYRVNIYRARPVLVVDGTTEVRVMTADQGAMAIAKDAGITLYREDSSSEESSDATLADSGVAMKLVITRANPVNVNLYGQQTVMRTQKKTIGALLKEKGIKLGASDRVAPAEDTPISPNMNIQIWREGKQTITVQESIPFTVRQIQDVDQPIGYKQVQIAGANGSDTVTYEIEIKNGIEVSRTQIQAVVTTQPTEEVDVIGTKVQLPAGSHEDWMAAAGISASDYGYVNYIVGHEGGWEPCKVQGGAIDCNYAGSMGYGVVQATPGSKMATAGSDWRTNPITQLRWATGYAVGRYGSWAGAYNYWTVHHNW